MSAGSPRAQAAPAAARSYAGRDLRGASFAGADLRGADFGGADLRGASFQGARTGLGPGALAAEAILVVLLGAASGLGASWMGERIRAAVFDPRPGPRVLGLVLLSEVILYAAAAIARGTPFAVRYVALPVSALFAVVAVGLVATRTGGAREVAMALAVPLFVLLVGSIIGVAAFARAAAFSAAPWLFFVVLVATVVGVRGANGTAMAVLVAVVATVVGARGRRLDARRATGVARLLARMMTWGGTSFRGARLDDADFAGARLRNTDFRGAAVAGARWDDAAEIEFCAFDAGAGRVPTPARSRRTRRSPPAG
ncbi:MAG TPA: pentapeptide repeat-containing protein [Polyangiaceae bacterium]|nr:pentapeptide repeat-containing protein [Polyangiaceae bacterium]